VLGYYEKEDKARVDLTMLSDNSAKSLPRSLQAKICVPLVRVAIVIELRMSGVPPLVICVI
jgi:hypothetical protein